MGLPDAAARQTIIADTLASISSVWRGAKGLEAHAARLAKAADGLDGRRIRKRLFAAMATDIRTACDPNTLTAAQIEATLREARRRHGHAT